MSDDFEEFDLPEPPVAAFAGDAAFDQAGIDALFGDVGAPAPVKSGLKAVIESNVISHERLPMLEVVYDRMVRTFATSMRNLTSDAIDVSLEEVSSIRFGDFMNRVMLPAMIGVFRVEEWENYGLITVESGLIYAVVDALLGGRKGSTSPLIDGRGFTSIETNLVSRMLQLALTDLRQAMEPIVPATMKLERVETSPRFAAIATPTNICTVATFRVDMEGRGGRFSVLLPYATIEPIRHKLAQRFMGEKLGRDNMWEGHMASEISKTEISLDVVLGEKSLTLHEIRTLAVGQTISLKKGPDDALELQCGGIPLGRAQIGQRCNNIAIRLLTDISRDLNLINFATLTNIATMVFCLAVLVQSVRMMRSLKTVKEGALTEVVGALDKSTAEARVVLSELKATLGECAASSRLLSESKEMAEELGVMIGIANASAERIMEAASNAKGANAIEPAEAAEDAVPA